MAFAPAASDYANLALWTDASRKACLDRVPDRWAQALLSRLFTRDPLRRPSDMSKILHHPFFHESYERSAPRLREGERHHVFLSHFQGNAVRCFAPFLCDGEDHGWSQRMMMCAAENVAESAI